MQYLDGPKSMTCNLPAPYDETKYAQLTSYAQLDCNQYLKTIQEEFKDKRALHVGIGNSSLFREFGQIFKEIVGITVVNAEIEAAKGYEVYKINKHDIKQLEKIHGKFDYIDDIGLKQYACCEEHWNQYFISIMDKLNPKGILITHSQGFVRGGDYVIEELTMKELREMVSKLDYKCEIIEIKEMTNRFGCYPVIIKKL